MIPQISHLNSLRVAMAIEYDPRSVNQCRDTTLSKIEGGEQTGV